jgi:ribosome maturation factor RimP
MAEQRIEAMHRALEPALARRGYELFDVTLTGQGRTRVLRVAIDRDGGIDLDAITEATEAVSAVLDGDDSLVAGPYALEVSSPGVERRLRRPVHYGRAVGETVTVKTHDVDGVVKRLRGVLLAADDAADGGITLEADDHQQRIGYDEIDGARTVFEWGPAPKPARAGKNKKRSRPQRTEALPRRAEAAEERQPQ